MQPLRRAVLAAILVLPSLASLAQDNYPSKPIRLIVPFGVGGGGDNSTRAMAAEMSKLWGQPFIIENKPGAHEMVGAEIVANSPPDGYTFLMGTESIQSLNPVLYSKLTYKPEDLVPVARMVTAPIILTVSSTFPANTLKEYIEEVRRNPGKYTIGSLGVGAPDHLAGAWFNNINGLNMQHIPFKSVAQQAPEQIAGRLDALFQSIGSMRPFITAGRVKVLAIGGRSRHPTLPNVPTFQEAGMPPEFDASFYIAVFAPKGTPQHIVNRFARDMGRVVNDPEFRNRAFAPMGFDPVAETPQQFAEFLKTDRERAARKVKISGAKLD